MDGLGICQSSIMNTNNWLNKIFPFFDSLNKEFSLGFHLIDIFSDCFSFISVNRKDFEVLFTHQNKLNNIYRDFLANHSIMLIVLDASIKNNIAILILHICRSQEIIAKTVHYTMNVTFSEVELFTISMISIMLLNNKTFHTSLLLQTLFLLLEKSLS